MKVKGYILAFIMAGVAFGPIRADDTAAITLSLKNEQQSEAQAAQQTDSSTNSSNNVKQGPTALRVVGICAVALLTVYALNRSITVAHEGGHALAAWLAGKKITEFRISSKFDGGGSMNYAPRGIGFKDICILLAGPLCGAAGYFAWAKLWDVGRYMLYGNEDKEMSLRAKLGGFTVAACGALLELKLNLNPSFSNIVNENYAACADSITGNDGEKMRKILVTISPIMGAVYPYIAYAGCAAFAGYSLYRIGQMLQDLEKEVSKRFATT